MKPLLCLSKTEKLFWPILTKAQSTPWTDVENMMASQMCRDLATVEELAQAQCGEELLPEICRRIHDGSQLLKLNNVTGTTVRHKIVQAIFTGV